MAKTERASPDHILPTTRQIPAASLPTTLAQSKAGELVICTVEMMQYQYHSQPLCKSRCKEPDTEAWYCQLSQKSITSSCAVPHTGLKPSRLQSRLACSGALQARLCPTMSSLWMMQDLIQIHAPPSVDLRDSSLALCLLLERRRRRLHSSCSHLAGDRTMLAAL